MCEAHVFMISRGVVSIVIFIISNLCQEQTFWSPRTKIRIQSMASKVSKTSHLSRSRGRPRKDEIDDPQENVRPVTLARKAKI